MGCVFLIPIVVLTSYLFWGVFSSQDFRERLCVPTRPESGDTNPQSQERCPTDHGILVEEIQATAEVLDEDCTNDDDSTDNSQEDFITAIPQTGKWENQSLEIELALHQACNGRRLCHFNFLMPAPIPIQEENLDSHFQTYITTYSCHPVNRGERQKTIGRLYDMAINGTFTGLDGDSILVLRSNHSFDRQCVITAPNGTITLDIMWISYNFTTKAWDACLNVMDSGNQSVYDVGCNQTQARQIMPINTKSLDDTAKTHVAGDSGFVWIRVSAKVPYELTCTDTKPWRSSPAGNRQELCISYSDVKSYIPSKTFACPENHGILVFDIRMTGENLNDVCKNSKRTQSVDLHHYTQYINKTRRIELVIKEACNGKRRCYLPHSLPGPISTQISLGYVVVYSSYIVKYRCESTKPDNADDNVVFDASKDFTALEQTAFATVIIESEKPFNRHCTITAPTATIYLVPHWMSYNPTTQRWDACMRIFQETVLEFEEGCDDMPVVKALEFRDRQYFNTVTLHVAGNSGFVWLHLSASRPFNVTCKAEVVQLTTETGGRQTTSFGNNVTTTIKAVTQADKENDSKLTTVIAIISTIAALATATAICLVIYIVYIRKGSSHQRRKVSRRLEHRLTQRMQEGQHPRVQSQRERSRQQQLQQKQQQNGDSTYDMYTYMDATDFKGSSICPRRDARAPFSTSGKAPDESYSVAQFKSGQHSTNDSFVKARTTAPGEYNQLGKCSDPSQSSGEGGMYDTVASGGYAHFNGANKNAKVVGNFYDG